MNLKEKLRELDRVQPAITAKKRERQSERLDHLLGGSEQDGCFVVERRFPLHLEYGYVRLDTIREIPPAALAIAGKDERLADIDISRALFLDTETTSIVGGTGTLPFLVGVGFLEGDALVVRQYFLRQPHEEPAMLMALQRWIDQCSGLVTFNGKSFDIPLLRTRAILNRQTLDWDRLRHFDVLHAARRFWKDQIENCSLVRLEEQILRLVRQQDIPSALIPQIYFEFLHYGNASPLPEVFAHNQHDIVSMAALLIRMVQLVQHPLRQDINATEIESDQNISLSPHELRRVAMLYRQLGDFDGSAKLFEQLLTQHTDLPSALEDSLALALCYKSQRRYGEANRVWREMITRLRFHPLPYIELAKHFEHREKAPQHALEWVERALRNFQLFEELDRINEGGSYKEDLLHRQKRLRRKLSSPRAVSPGLPHSDREA